MTERVWDVVRTWRGVEAARATEAMTATVGAVPNEAHVYAVRPGFKAVVPETNVDNELKTLMLEIPDHIVNAYRGALAQMTTAARDWGGGSSITAQATGRVEGIRIAVHALLNHHDRSDEALQAATMRP